MKKNTEITTSSKNILYTIANERVGAAVINKDTKLKIHFPKLTSIYSVEVVVIEKALKEIQKSNVINEEYAICSDSLSILHSITKLYRTNTIIWNTQNLYTTLIKKNNKIVLIWVTSHMC